MSIGRKTLTNIAGSVIPLLVTIVTVPLYLKILGDVRYGVLALVWLILSYFAFMEMGLGKATTNHIARLTDAPDRERASLFWTALAVNAGFGMAAALIFWGIGSYLMTNVLKIPPEFRAEALAALPWIIATLPLALVSSVLNGALEGRNRFFVVNGLQIVSALVFQVVPLAVAYIYGPSLSVVIPAAVLSRAFMNIPFLGACFFYVPLSTRPAFSRESVRSLMSYGGWVAISGMIGPILETMDRFLIGIILGAQAVTHYTVPYQLVTKARVLPGSLARALFPKFSAAASQETDALAMAALHSLALAMTPLVVGGIVFLHPFMNVWVGEDLATIASPLGGIFFFGIWINSLAYIPYCLLQAKGKPDIVAKFHALELGPFLFVLWAALSFWGITGAAWAWTIRTVTDAVLLFRFSGMPKRCLWALGEPALMISFATLGARSIVGESWPWRAALFLILVIWVGRWLAKNKVGALITAYRARQTNAAVGEEGGVGSREKNLHSVGGSHKAAGYYRHRRENISAFLDKGGHRLLDVGCGAGQFGAYLKQHGYASEVVGIEKDPKAAEEATAHLDHVFRVDLNGTTISELLSPSGIETGSFDVVVCADVLEHLVDPWQTLSGLSEYLAPGGKVIASIPNVRHWSVWLPLLLKGRWDYTDAGIMDRTHLRFFTRATMRELFVVAGLDVVEDRPLIGGKWRLLDTCSMHLLRELVAVQWVFVAKRKAGTTT